ncbi:hypothetical protein D3273_16270 [Lichenibacterium minor]|jgi:hypothetical protein|uniref:Uncharacterized protein n=1 Tax=Lichenibacterium minor TaxID=2316528 RepID=A0A4V1RUF0_9HYPH|nr:hypothetical protein [Lichenibacterium minor]RYC30924.1 hypothetical protein D3273_16270 [Lichenibacterium minor]
MTRPFRALAFALAAASALAGAASGAQARPVVPAEKRYYDYDGDLPVCGDTGVLSTISSRFARKESEYWNTSLEIVSFDRVKLLAARPWGADHIPRNFCTARALLNDNSYHDVSYSVTQDLGIIGYGTGVEWCLLGLDRDLAYAPACQLARP